ncbi:MAG: flagellar biosynthesis anti-sigma factor FlgM [Acidobacteriota bacterium]
MEVNKVGTYQTEALQQPREPKRQVGGEGKAPSSGASAPPDKVELSRGYQGMAQVKKVMMDGQDVRSDRVEQLRNMIQNGTYKVQPEAIAEKMVEEGF